MRTPLLLAAALLCTTACDFLQPKVSQQKLEAALTDWLKEHDLEASDIHCPDNQLLEKGNVFECTCKVHGTDIPVRVEVTDASSGTVEWKPKYVTLTGEQFAKEVRERPNFAEHDVEITCSDKVLVSIPDSTWTCEIVDKGDGNKAYTATIEFTDGEGTHNMNVEPK